MIVQDHLRPQPDRLLMAKLDGIIWRHARWYEPAQEETDAAVAELREVADGRPDLLAEAAGVLLGFHEGGLDEPRAKAAASFCLAAGADAGQVAWWTEEGRRRAEEARLPRSADRVVHLGAHEPLYFANGEPLQWVGNIG